MPTPADHVLRPLAPADQPASLALGIEAFGTPPSGSDVATPAPAPGRRRWGTFDADGRLVARAVACEFGSWFGGAEIPTCGVAGVSVVAERRGEGLLEDLVRALLDEALERGDVIATLYPTAPGIYRRFGFELVGSLDSVELPTAELAGLRAPAGVTTRRATAADVPAVRRVHERWAAAQNGPLTRRGPAFVQSAQDQLADVTGVTLALDGAGEVAGYAAWRRGEGYGATATLEVDDLLATSADAYRALWRVLGSFVAVTGRVRLRSSGDDPARLVLPGGSWTVVGTHAYGLRLLDVERAFTMRPLPHPAELAFTVAGDGVGHTDGGFRLRVGADRTTCARADLDGHDRSGPVFTPQGLALAWAGVQSCANLRMTGHLSGAQRHDATLDALLGGRRLQLRDYF